MIKKTFEVTGKTIDNFTSFILTELSDWITRSSTDDGNWAIFYFNDYKTKGIEINKTNLKSIYTCNLNEDGTFSSSIDSVTSNAIKYNFYIEENNKFIFMTYVYVNGTENYICLVQLEL